MLDKLVHKDLSYRIRGVLFRVHNELGNRCNEKQYCDRIEFLFLEYRIPYKREVVFSRSFGGEKAGRNRADFVVAEKILLEVKCHSSATKNDYFQCQRYLRASGLRLALLVNFRTHYLIVKRVLNYSLDY